MSVPRQTYRTSSSQELPLREAYPFDLLPENCSTVRESNPQTLESRRSSAREPRGTRRSAQVQHKRSTYVAQSPDLMVMHI